MRRRQSSISAEQAQELWNNAHGASVGDGMTVQCKLITPMYGGGVKRGEVDEAMPIRASGIRGQLRFWWRLLYGVGRSSEELFKCECKLWGGIASGGPMASKVALRVSCEPAASFVRKTDLERRQRDLLSYVLIGDDPKLLDRGYSFKLLLRFDQRVTDCQRSQVVECLRWWASFGGVGARTRRGLGAIKAKRDDADLKPVSSTEVAGLGGRMAVGPAEGDAMEAWKAAVGALEFFRQGQGVGRKAGKGLPGGSQWPEANAIRGLADPARSAPDRKDGLFPRAAFGLPIGFQFKGEGHLDDTLEGEDGERMASPLILRPYFDGRGYCSMALLLPGWEDRIGMAVTMKEWGSVGLAWPKPSSEGEQERRAKEVVPMRSRGRDPLTAFMHYFDERVNGRG